MKSCLFFFMALLVSCSAGRRKTIQDFSDVSTLYHLKDRSGSFVVKRSITRRGGRVAVKREVFSPSEMNIPLEKTVLASDLGQIRTERGSLPSFRPSASQHTIWYEKQRFFSQLKLNPASKSLDVVMKSPEDKWNGSKSFPFPKGRKFCFFTQLPECVKAHGLLEAVEKPARLHIIWDNFPYHQEMYEKVSEDPFEEGIWAFDRNTNAGRRFGLVLGGQLILYEFDPDGNFQSMYWVAQGITMTVQKN